MIQIHKFIRKFYISELDEEILDEEEKAFSGMIDALQLRSYMILRSMERFPTEYHEKARTFMQTIREIDTQRSEQQQKVVGKENEQEEQYQEESYPGVRQIEELGESQEHTVDNSRKIEEGRYSANPQEEDS